MTLQQTEQRVGFVRPIEEHVRLSTRLAEHGRRLVNATPHLDQLRDGVRRHRPAKRGQEIG